MLQNGIHNKLKFFDTLIFKLQIYSALVTDGDRPLYVFYSVYRIKFYV